jgi:hypothetical protein
LTLDVKVITLEILIFFAEHYHLICRSKAAALLYNYIFESRLFHRYLNEGIIHELLTAAVEVMVEDDACYDFIGSYIKSLTDGRVVAHMANLLTNYADLYIRTPNICLIFNDLYLKADYVTTMKLNYIFLPIVSDLLISLNTSQLISTFVTKSDELTLMSLVDILCSHILHHMVLQK